MNFSLPSLPERTRGDTAITARDDFGRSRDASIETHFCRTRRLPLAVVFALTLASVSLAAQAQDDPPVDPKPNVPKEEPVDPVTMTASVVPDTIAAYTDTATLSWSSTNAHVCEYDGTDRSVSGSETVGPYNTSGTKSFVITCTGTGEGNFAEFTVNLTVTQAPPPEITTTLSANVLEAGVDSLIVTWNADYADYCFDSGGNSYPVSGTANLGTFTVGDHSLSFSCAGEGGTTPHTIEWKALDPVTVDASVSDTTILANGSDTVTVSWTSENADSCDLGDTDDDIDYGPYSYSDAGTKSATVTCENDLGSASDTVTWEVEALPPVINLSLSDYTITENTDEMDLFWLSDNTDSCTYDSVIYRTDDSVLGLGPYPAGTYTFTVSCTGTGGTRDASIVLTVVPQDPPDAPENLGAAPNPSTDGSFTLVWDAPSSGTTPTGYLVYLQGSVSPLTKPFEDLSLSITGLSDGSYTYEVEACAGTETAPNCGTAATVTVTVAIPGAPDAPENLAATPNPSTDGSFTLTWDAPSSGTTPTGYLVYLQGSSSPLSKPFADLTLSITGLSDDSYTYEVKACIGTETAPVCGTAATVSVTVAIPDTDGDGIKDPDDLDDDNDGMPDDWELANGLDPLDESDATDDDDGDGHDNKTEYTHDTDPQSSLSHPLDLPEASEGFSSSYTVERGLIDGDQLQDILIRNPTPGIQPAVAPFVMIQQSAGGFVIQDANLHMIPPASQLTDIGSVIRLRDLNGDGFTDMLLFGLDSYVDGADNDRIVFSNYNDPNTVPTDEVALSDEEGGVVDFFSDLSAWI